MFISVFTTPDNKFFLYLPFIKSDKQSLDLYEDLPEVVVNKFKNARYITSLNAKTKKLIQIKDLDAFLKQIEENGFYVNSIEENFIENQIIQK